MITCHEICFVILTIVLGSISAFDCPTNPACTCQPNYDRGIEINCLMKNDSLFIINIQRDQYIKIECINSPEWSDFNLDVSSKWTKNIKSISFYMCDLPTNNSLGEIARKLSATDVEKLIFQSYKNLSFALVKHHLDDFENLKFLILSSNNVTYVDKDLLAGLVNLTGLNLRDNNLHLVAGFFNHTPGLQWLELGENALRSIELGTFDDLKNLTLLNLWKNHLTEPQSGIFDELIALKTLDLNANNMIKLPDNIFAKLENLEILNLSRNNFTHLPRNLLQNNTKLHTVSLFDNKRNMTTLPNEFFANLTELKVLKLRKNGFVTLPEDLFWGCTSLTNLTLERNYLQTLPVYIFRDLNELKELELNFNDLETLPNNIFWNTNRLVKLDLSKNRITSISKHLFNGLYALKELNMEENQLKTISSHSFSSLKELKIAKFSNNYLTLDTYHEYPGPFGSKSPFYDCVSLQELYLANNSISKIFSDWILSDLGLRKLDLKYNNISMITVEDLQFVSNNIEVDLTHNKIEHIFLRDAEELISYQEDIRNAKILVNDNPLNCDCGLYDFLRYIERKMHPRVPSYLDIIPGNLSCQSPEDLKNELVTNLKSESLTCIVEDSNVCPEDCICFVRPEGSAFIIDCSYKNLMSLPSDIKKPGDVFQLELNFSGNRLTDMPDLKAMGFESVQKLILSHNNINKISLSGLSNTIQVLELHNNNLSRIQLDVLKFLKQSTNLTRLTLHENPWECDCDAKDFRNFIQTNLERMPDLLKVKCPGKNTFISKMTVTDFCPLYTARIIGISVAISLLMGFLIGLFGLLYYKYQRQIKVWLFAHQWCLRFVTEEELDKEKVYDAFVSYSHKDHDFVVNELVSKLENGPRTFKLCLHYRDWIAGEWIPANIANSVENSRRTIVVLSPNFLESVWGRMEFRAAHSQALSEGRARVILILYGDIEPTDDLDPELKAYISMNTYVKWGDPWFWDKLRYALPHQSKLAKNNPAGKKIFENHQLCIQTNGDKKELIYPTELPETPPTTTPPAETLKKFICDKESEEQLFLNGYPGKSYKNENVSIILSPEHLMKHDNEDCLASTKVIEV